MKLLSVTLTVMLLGGVASTAAAADYESNSPLLAANTDDASSAMPDVQARSGSAGMAAIANGDSDEGQASEAAHLTRPETSPHPDASARTPGPSVGGKPRAPAPVQPTAPPATASWQSLLPGSIQ